MKKKILILFIFSFFSNFTLPIKINDKAPDFKLYDDKGNLRSLNEFSGKKIVLFFYPKNDSWNCTKQACNFQDNTSLYEKNGIILIGINYDSIKSHKNFKKKHNLSFILLSDPKGIVTKKYGANKGLFGWFVPQRKTFLINKKGYIIHIFKKIDISNQANDILKKFG